MTALETNRFIDSLTFEDNTVRLYGRVYWCLRVSWNEKAGRHYFTVFECDKESYEWIRGLLLYESESFDECMRHFLEDKYWDGKSFYEVAPDMEWIDL